MAHKTQGASTNMAHTTQGASTNMAHKTQGASTNMAHKTQGASTNMTHKHDTNMAHYTSQIWRTGLDQTGSGLGDAFQPEAFFCFFFVNLESRVE